MTTSTQQALAQISASSKSFDLTTESGESAMTAATSIFTANNVLTIQTTKTAPIRTLFGSLKDIILETNIYFTKNGLRIINMDKSHTILVYMDLPAANFELFECKKDKIIVCMNMLYLFKIINMIEPNETLTMYIEEADYNDGSVSNITLKYVNKDLKRCTIHKLKSIEPDNEEMTYPDVKFSSVITMPSVEFQKTIRNLSNISNKVEIKSVGDELIFKCGGSFADTEIKWIESQGSISFLQKNNPGKLFKVFYP